MRVAGGGGGGGAFLSLESVFDFCTEESSLSEEEEEDCGGGGGHVESVFCVWEGFRTDDDFTDELESPFSELASADGGGGGFFGGGALTPEPGDGDCGSLSAPDDDAAGGEDCFEAADGGAVLVSFSSCEVC